MSQTKTTAVSYNAILKKAKSGEYKLPAFQRKWKWTTRQVMSLYESLRLGYPIGAFLFLTSPEGEKLGPRAFHGAGKKASGHPSNESLVLDGQQRITAGLSIYYGLDDVDGSEYYIDCKKVDDLLRERKINIDDVEEVKKFCESLDLEDGYLVPKPKKLDRRAHFVKSSLLWTAFLTEERQSDLDELVDALGDKRKKDVVRRVVRQHLRPNTNIQVPVIELGTEFDLAEISKVFSTINSTGKLLTPFELVVAILYPNGVRLEDDVDQFKSKYPYYANMDKNGEILLQVVALLSGNSPKKSDLPKTIQPDNYKSHAEGAAKRLNAAGEFLSSNLGVGLDVTDKLIPYDAIFAPLAIVLDRVVAKKLSNAEIGTAKQKLRRWFVASAINQRYQEGVHNKQEKDVVDIETWVYGGATPPWIENTFATPAIKLASPSGAIGKLMLCLINSDKPKDPIQNAVVGFRDGAPSSQIHHIYPSRWAPKGIVDYSKGAMDTNIALNTMVLATETNSDWLNFDPKTQLEQSEKAITPAGAAAAFGTQLIDANGIALLRKNDKSMADYQAFIDARYRSLLAKLKEFEVQESTQQSETVELDEPSISE